MKTNFMNNLNKSKFTIQMINYPKLYNILKDSQLLNSTSTIIHEF